jgi:hypothetical protein
MKKKMEALLKDGSLAGNAEFAALQKAQQSAKRALEKSKKEKSEAKNAYRDAIGKDGKDDERLFELLTAFRQSKFMHKYHQAGHKLAKNRLMRWLEGFLKNIEVPHEPLKLKTPKSKSKKAEQAKAEKPSKQKTPASAKN